MREKKTGKRETRGTKGERKKTDEVTDKKLTKREKRSKKMRQNKRQIERRARKETKKKDRQTHLFWACRAAGGARRRGGRE